MTWTLETQRLLLRPMDVADLDALAAVAGDPYTMRFYRKPLNRSMTLRMIEETLERYERDGFGLLAVAERASGDVIGDCGASTQDTSYGRFVELGWHIRLDRQGNGFATEAGRACRDQAWKELSIDRLICIVRPENVPSWSVARALGFHAWRGEVRHGMAHVLWSLEPPVSR